MLGYVAVTDPGWYELLSKQAGPRDANFWRPSPRPLRLDIGTPFFFKLKAPHHAIAGYGLFAGFSVLPDWLAWETFGDGNGVESLAVLRDRLKRIQLRAGISADPAGRIGCSLIAEAKFFARDAWVAPPVDWHVRTQTGAGWDLSKGEGLRIWQECIARTSYPAADPRGAGVAEARFGAPLMRLPRLGQEIFRVRVLDAYDRACTITREHSLPVLEAAHIRPYSLGGEHEIANGLVLRTDLHRLFDRGYVTVDEDHRLVVGSRLKVDFDNGRTYYALHGSSLLLPIQVNLHPSPRALAWHREEVFLG